MDRIKKHAASTIVGVAIVIISTGLLGMFSVGGEVKELRMEIDNVKSTTMPNIEVIERVNSMDKFHRDRSVEIRREINEIKTNQAIMLEILDRIEKK